MTKNKSKEKNKIKSKEEIVKKLTIILIILIFLVSFTTTLGRYTFIGIKDFFLRTKEFYFYSDKLSSTTSYFQIDNWSGTGDYTIIINMNSRLNNIKKVDYDIPYTIEYRNSNNCTCQLSKTNGIISGTTNTDQFQLILTPNIGLRTNDRVSVTIKASTSSKYTTSIDGTFVLIVGKESLSYEIVDSVGSKYFNLNITNTLSYYNVKEAFDSYSIGDRIDVDTYLTLSSDKKSKCYSAEVTLSFDPNLVLLDLTNDNYINSLSQTRVQIGSTNYINGITFNVDPISSIVIRFYKLNVNSNYTYPITNPTSIITVTSR